jgi:DNA-binding CsgD family transcriptional regulator
MQSGVLKMQMSGNVAQKKNRSGRQNLEERFKDLHLQEGPRREADECVRKDARPNSAGFLLLDHSLRPLYVNQEALAALAYPASPSKNNGFDFLEDRIQSLFSGSNGSRQPKGNGFIVSGKRCYQLRVFSVRSSLTNGCKRAVAILLERNRKPKVDLSYLSGRFRLTQREVETVDHLAQGANTQEIADRMKISPNTVKAFLRSIMMKMGTDTRAGIIAKILQVSNSVIRETSS